MRKCRAKLIAQSLQVQAGSAVKHLFLPGACWYANNCMIMTLSCVVGNSDLARWNGGRQGGTFDCSFFASGRARSSKSSSQAWGIFCHDQCKLCLVQTFPTSSITVILIDNKFSKQSYLVGHWVLCRSLFSTWNSSSQIESSASVRQMPTKFMIAQCCKQPENYMAMPFKTVILSLM